MTIKYQRVSRASRKEDDLLLPYIKKIVNERASYGYRRVTTLLNRQLQLESKPKVNHKQVYRIMKEHGLLLPAYGKKQTRLHDGKIITLRSNTR